MVSGTTVKFMTRPTKFVGSQQRHQFDCRERGREQHTIAGELGRGCESLRRHRPGAPITVAVSWQSSWHSRCWLDSSQDVQHAKSNTNVPVASPVRPLVATFPPFNTSYPRIAVVSTRLVEERIAGLSHFRCTSLPQSSCHPPNSYH